MLQQGGIGSVASLPKRQRKRNRTAALGAACVIASLLVVGARTERAVAGGSCDCPSANLSFQSKARLVHERPNATCVCSCMTGEPLNGALLHKLLFQEPVEHIHILGNVHAITHHPVHLPHRSRE